MYIYILNSDSVMATLFIDVTCSTDFASKATIPETPEIPNTVVHSPELYKVTITDTDTGNIYVYIYIHICIRKYSMSRLDLKIGKWENSPLATCKSKLDQSIPT